jgi:apolipoprotein N-acyltransferase
MVGNAPRAARLARHVSLSTDRAAAGASLIVWPEHALDAYLEEPSDTRDAILHLAAATGSDLILGGPHFTPSAAGTRYHNSAYLVHRGHIAGRYDKHRLVPFAEDRRGTWLSGSETTLHARARLSRLAATDLRAGMLPA